MDPGFIPILASQLNQHYQNQSFAKLQAQEEHEKQERQKLLEAVRSESDVLLHESSLKPQSVFVRCQIICFNLNSWKVVPDTYEDQKEKEDVALLWRKLVGISDKCKTLMTPEQVDQCMNCLDAMWMQGFIHAIAERLEAYNELQQTKTVLEKKRANQKIWRNISLVILAIITIGAGLLFYKHNSIKSLGDLFGLLISFPVPIGALFYLLFGSKIKAIDDTYHRLLGNVDEEFWDRVKEKFHGIPTEEILKQSWDQQEMIIKVIFGEPVQASSTT